MVKLLKEKEKENKKILILKVTQSQKEKEMLKKHATTLALEEKFENKERTSQEYIEYIRKKERELLLQKDLLELDYNESDTFNLQQEQIKLKLQFDIPILRVRLLQLITYRCTFKEYNSNLTVTANFLQRDSTSIRRCSRL